MTIYDTFMANAEFDMLECRMTELEAIPDLIHVLVEADVDHQGHDKPCHFATNWHRFERWKKRLRIIRAGALPSVEQDPDPWAREHAQREYVKRGVDDASPDDIVLHGDIDEIPTVPWVWSVANAPTDKFHVAMQRFHCFAVDWLHPQPWPGTVAGRYSRISTFSEMRDIRLIGYTPAMQAQPPNGGWHFSWVGGREATIAKLGSFCHPEIADWCADGLADDSFYDAGYHVDGEKLTPVTVDQTWPKWIREGHAPEAWFRRSEGRQLVVNAGKIVRTQ